VQNEPVYSFEPASNETQKVQTALKHVQENTEEIPIVIGGREIWTEDIHYQVSVCSYSKHHKILAQ